MSEIVHVVIRQGVHGDIIDLEVFRSERDAMEFFEMKAADQMWTTSVNEPEFNQDERLIF